MRAPAGGTRQGSGIRSLALAAASVLAVAIPGAALRAQSAPPGSVIGPVIAEVVFEGNTRLAPVALGAAAQLPIGTPLSAAAIQPAIDRLTAAYQEQGGAYISPSIEETARDRVRVTFQVHEGATYVEGPEEAPVPGWFDVYFGNTMACAAATTGNDLCHMWLNRDGTFVIFDQSGVHRGTWKAGKVRADGRVPICRFWRMSEFTLPPEVAQAQTSGAAPPLQVAVRMKVLGMPSRTLPPPPVPGAPKSVRLCLTKNFRTTCTVHPNVAALSPELQRKAGLSVVALRNEEGICYAHGPHKVGEVWYEWDDPLPGQVGLDRQMLMAGRQ